MNLFVGLDKFGITIQKGQYDNVQMLLELSSEYLRFLNAKALVARKQNLTGLDDLLESTGHEISKKSIKILYKQIFDLQLDVSLAADPKKPEKLLEALEEDLITNGKFDLYHAILLGINSEDLQLWAREVVTKKVNDTKRE